MNFLVWKTYFLCAILPTVLGGSLEVSTQSLHFEEGEFRQFSVQLSEPVNESVTIFLNYADLLTGLQENATISNKGEGVLNFTVGAKGSGQTTILIHSNCKYVDDSNAFIRVHVARNSALDIVADVLGWVYFFVWSFCYYPQIYKNWRRKSVLGYDFDYLTIHVTGYVSYLIYNVGLMFIDVVQQEYKTLHPTGVIPVNNNDFAFNIHVMFTACIIIFQCCFYERGKQALSWVIITALTALIFGLFTFLILISLEIIKNQPWLKLLYYFSYIKVASAVIKYAPQVYHNFKRKSTAGWSIEGVLLDIVGSSLSIAQMFVIAYNYDDWKSIFGNFAKFGLGLITVTYDVLFMVQHYCLYHAKREEYEKLS